MASTMDIPEDPSPGSADEQSESFFSDVLEPGSSFHPTFLALLDGAFAFLFVVLVSLAYLTSGNLHLIFLILIELALWASVKWFISEWNKIQASANQGDAIQIQRFRDKEE